MRRGLCVVGLAAACTSHPVPHIGGDGGADARFDGAPVAIDAAPDAAIDAAPDAPPDATPWSITIDAPEFPADPFTHHAVTVTGPPNTEVSIATDRIHAGALFPFDLVLDGSGHGSATYVPCSPAIPTCVGTATLELVLPMQPQGIVEATTPITIDDPGTGIGDGSACAGSDNVMYYRSTDYPHPAWTFQSAANAVWSVFTYPDAARFTIDGAQRLELSLQGIATPLAAGTFTNTQLSPPSEAGRAAMRLVSDCDGSGRFVIDEMTEDPVYGTLQSMTLRFDESGCGDQAYTVGCLHYVAPPTTPPPGPPIPDPSKLAVQVYEADGGGVPAGTPDTTAIAILTDATGAVVLDTTVDSFGFAQAPMIGTGELTVIQHSGFYEYAHTYRGVHAGNYVVVNAPPVTTGPMDSMLVTYAALPPNSSPNGLFAPCMSGTGVASLGFPVAEINFYNGCRTSTFNMLSVIGFNDGTPSEWLWQTGLDHVANGNVHVAGTWAPFTTANVSVTNVPASIPSLFLKLSAMVGSGVGEIGRAGVDSPAPGTVSFALPYPVGGGDGMVIDLQSENGLTTNDWITKVLTGSSANVTLDYAANPVPLVSSIQQSASGASWTETGGGSVDVRTVFWRGLANQKKVIWMIVEPYDGHASSTLPVLPANHASDDPATDPALELHGAAALYRDYDVTPGFTLTPPVPPYETRQTGAQTYDMAFPY
ncbi:MAG: hypothetical protein JO257_01310 [Deltaproteobacteria bacterium]|nr:hypothetical protein [Deltaproteobacteria bacterium]